MYFFMQKWFQICISLKLNYKCRLHKPCRFTPFYTISKVYMKLSLAFNMKHILTFLNKQDIILIILDAPGALHFRKGVVVGGT